MAVKTLYILATNAVTPNFWGNLQDGGSAPTAANTAYGWGPAKTATTTPYYRGRLGSTAVGGDAAVASSYNAGTSGPAKGTGTGASTAGDSFVAGPYSGTFAATAWTFNFNLRAGTAGAIGHINLRVWKSANADGSSATQLLANTAGLTVTLSTTADVNSSVSWSPGALTLNNEYLFFQVEWQETTAGTSNNDNIFFRANTALITTPDFAQLHQGATRLAGAGAVPLTKIIQSWTVGGPLLFAGAGGVKATALMSNLYSLELMSASGGFIANATILSAPTGQATLDGFGSLEAIAPSLSIAITTTGGSGVIVACTICDDPNGAGTPTAPGLTFTQRQNYLPTAGNRFLQTFIAPYSTNFSGNVTVPTFSGVGHYIEATVFGVTGTAGAFDGSASGVTGGAISFTTATDNDFVFVNGIDGAGDNTHLASGWTRIGGPGGVIQDCFYRSVTPPGSYSFQMDPGSNINQGVTVDALISAGGATAWSGSALIAGAGALIGKADQQLVDAAIVAGAGALRVDAQKAGVQSGATLITGLAAFNSVSLQWMQAQSLLAGAAAVSADATIFTAGTIWNAEATIKGGVPGTAHSSYFVANDTNIVLSNNNLTVTKPVGNADGYAYKNAYTQAANGSKVYWEFQLGHRQFSEGTGIGICNPTGEGHGNSYPGQTVNSYGVFEDGVFFYNNAQIGTLPGFVAGDVVGAAIDFGAGTFQLCNFTQAGSWSTPVDVSAITSSASTRFMACLSGTNDSYTVNFDGAFVGSPPASGYTRWDGSSLAGVIVTDVTLVKAPGALTLAALLAGAGATAFDSYVQYDGPGVTLNLAGALQLAGAGALVVDATVSGAAHTTWDGATRLSGAGIFAANANQRLVDAAIFSGVAALAGKADQLLVDAAFIAGAGARASAITSQLLPTAFIAGASSLAVNANQLLVAATQIAGVASRASLAVLSMPAAAGFAGAGTLAADATSAGVQSGATLITGLAAFNSSSLQWMQAQTLLSGAGNLVGIANQTALIGSKHTFDGIGAVAANVNQMLAASGLLPGVGLFRASATQAIPVAALVAGTTTFVPAVANLGVAAAGVVAGAGSIAGSVGINWPASAVLRGAGAVSADTSTAGTAFGNALLAATGAQTALAQIQLAASTRLTAFGAFAGVLATQTLAGATRLAAVAQVAADARAYAFLTDEEVAGAGAVKAALAMIAQIGSALSVSGALQAKATRVNQVAALLQGAGLVQADVFAIGKQSLNTVIIGGGILRANASIAHNDNAAITTQMPGSVVVYGRGSSAAVSVNASPWVPVFGGTEFPQSEAARITGQTNLIRVIGRRFK